MPITDYISSYEPYRRLVSALMAGGQRAYAAPSFQGYLLAALAADLKPGGTLLVAAADAAAAVRLAAELKVYAGALVLRLPSRGVARGSALKPSRQTVGLRHEALAGLREGAPLIVVADIAALMERELDAKSWPQPFALTTSSGAGFDHVVERLAGMGYERLDQVEDPGQFSVRGGIIDVFPTGAAAPLRLEFWGEQLESMRRFSPYTQRSLADEEKVTVFAAAEPGPVAGGGLLDAEKNIWLCRLDPGLAADSTSSFWDEASDQLGEEKASGYYLRPRELEGKLAGARLTLESLPSDQPHRFPVSGIDFSCQKMDEAARVLDSLISEEFRVFVCFATEGAARRAAHGLAEKAALLAPGLRQPEGPGAWLTVAPPPAGFVSRELKLAVVPEKALLRPGRSARSQQLALGGRAVLSFRELTGGDFVVHQDHGIGIFDSIQTRTVAGVTRDYLLLRFRDDDRLFVPQEQISRVSRYVGAGAGAPPLNKLGGRAWELARSRARSAAREMAGELLQLYALRQSLPGHAFGPDNEWQMELEADFPFTETDDQAAAISDVKDDMEEPHPMDRLICGDVGYGKTEVALRAAFKATSQGRQVLLLAPTTILALQHFNTFSDRIRKFPINVEMISRFRSAARSRRLAADFREGRIDILIGTHRLLSADIQPRRLGLVIIDEEQRFGVGQKEALRQLRLKVDVLSLSATPIPRTLQMSLSGLRDISIMETPPPGRNPIRTYVGDYDQDLAGEAIRREVGRGGQVFFLHNRVQTIEARASELRALFPQVRFLVAHGQMPEGRLEAVMAAFLSREADVLVCTSIIESGLDIPSVNTLIVDHAQRLGLAQLYQIRGRIGRSPVPAHAYLFYPAGEAPTPEAMARLSTLSDNTELGSGFRIAMRDLEIRGAGNLLGQEQSGHVAAVGFEMYCDLIRSAVAALQNKPLEEQRIVRVDIDVDAFIPASYIPFEAARIDVHHRIAAACDEEELKELRLELGDRFGEPPDVVYNLLDMQVIRLRAAVMGAASVSFRRGRLQLGGIRLDPGQRGALEGTGLETAFSPLRQALTVWLRAEAGEGVSVVKQTLDAIIGSLFTPLSKL